MSAKQKFVRLAEEPEMQVVRRRLMAKRNGSHQENGSPTDDFLGGGERRTNETGLIIKKEVF